MERILVNSEDFLGGLLNTTRLSGGGESVVECLNQLSADVSLDGAVIRLGSQKQIEEVSSYPSFCLKPLVFVVTSELNSVPLEHWMGVPVVVVNFTRDGTALAIRSKDASDVMSHFTMKQEYLSSPSVGIALLFWIACLRTRNVMRMNRFSLYWQQHLNQRYGIYTLGDFISKMKGGYTRGEILQFNPLDLWFNHSIAIHGRKQDDLRFLEEAIRSRESGSLIAHVMFGTDVQANRQDILRVLHQSTLNVVLLVRPATETQIPDLFDMERVCILESVLLQAVQQTLMEFVSVHLFTARKSVVSDSVKDSVIAKDLRSLLLQTNPRPRISNRTAAAVVTLDAFRQAMSFQSDVQNRPFYGTTRTTQTAFTSSGVRSHEPWSAIDTGAGFPRGSSPEVSNRTSIVVSTDRAPNLYSKEKTLNFQSKRDDSSSIAQIEKFISGTLQTNSGSSVSLFHQFHLVLPMIRSAELQAYHEAWVLWMKGVLNNGAGRALFRFGSNANSSQKWAEIAYMSQLMHGGCGSPSMCIWIDKSLGLGATEAGDISQTDPDEVAKVWISSSHSLERHSRMRIALGDDVLSPKALAYLSTLTRSLSLDTPELVQTLS